MSSTLAARPDTSAMTAKMQIYGDFINQLELQIAATNNVLSRHRGIKLVGSNNGILSHDDLLNPFWQRFASALMRRCGACQYFLHIQGVQLPKAVLDILLPALENQKLVKFRLVKNDLESEGFRFLANFLRRNNKVKVLRVQENNMAIDFDSLSEFACALGDNTSLERLEISSCGLGHSPSVFSRILDGMKNKKNAGIVLEDNNLSVSAYAALSSFLGSDPQLNELHIADIITDSDAEIVSNALRSNTNLSSFSMSGRPFGTSGNVPRNVRKILSKAIFDGSSLNAVADSNHTCIVLVNGVTFEDAECQNRVCSPEANRQRKVLTAVCSSGQGCVNVSLLKEVPVQFMPNVLHLLQIDCDNPKVFGPKYAKGIQDYRTDGSFLLTNVFEVMKHCNMPIMYSFVKSNGERNNK